MENDDYLDNQEENIPTKNLSIDKLTLELLSSRSKYKKYLSKEEPEKLKQQDKFQQKLKKYGQRIKNLTESLISDYEMPVTNDVNDIFYNYANVLIRHFEMRELENRSGGGNTEKEESDEEVLFKDISDDEGNTNTYSQKKATDYDTLLANTSYWGKPIKRI